MTRKRKIAALLLLVATISTTGLKVASAADNTQTYAYLPNHSVYFYDVSQDYKWAYREVDALASSGVITGNGSYLFNPANPITRADFMVMLDRAYGMSNAVENGSVSAVEGFSDVKKGIYYEKAVNAARALGIAVGSGNLFSPQDNMTRQDAMVFLKRTLDCTDLSLPTGTLTGFSDADAVNGYAKNAVSSLVQAKVITGSDGKIMPKSSVTRAQMAVMLYRALNLEENGGVIAYGKRSDVMNVCIGSKIYCDVVIQNYDAKKKYGNLMRYSKLSQKNGITYITLEESQEIDRTGRLWNGELILSLPEEDKTVSYPVADDCVAIDIGAPYHQMDELVSTGSGYDYCYPSIANGEIVVVYYKK